MGRDEQLQTPPCFSDAECCLYCIHSVRIDSSNNFLKCEKYKITCEDTTTCNEYALGDYE